jgi:RHS repeat-associated protein
LLEVRQTTGSLNDLLVGYDDYTSGHQPETMTDPAGETTTFTYNAAGQVLTVTNTLSETTTYAYNTDGYLTSVTGPVTGATTTYAYDDYGRIESVTDSDNYEVVTDYDELDRPTQTTYPDTTHEDITYDKLDAVTRRDREGKITRTFYDALRRIVTIRDPLGRTVTQQWCGCGSLDKLIDAKGQTTTWERDVQGRMTREVRADGTTDTDYVYETTTSRLKTVTDPKGQVTTYIYANDDRVLQMAFTNETITTSDVSFTYDSNYPRLSTMVDGTGTTTYTYRSPGTPGAGQVATVDGPLINDTIAITYDEIGRMTSRLINGYGISSLDYDPLGRLTEEENELGTFTFGYDGVTNRLESVTYPNGQTSTYSYFANNGDRRLQTIHHQTSAPATLSKFDYTYSADGDVLTWRQQAGTDAVMWEYGYDAAEQLTRAVKKSTDPTPSILKRFTYVYDAAGNRTIEQIDNGVVGASHNNLNRLTSHQPSGAIRVTGTVNEAATVSIQGKPASVSSGGVFDGTATIPSGTSTFTITATDTNNNATNKTYEIANSGSTKTFTYDANGNMTSDGTRSFEWDARNQLVAVDSGTHRTEFHYNGSQRRVQIVEKENGVVQTDARFVWCGGRLCERRESGGGTVVTRYFHLGEDETQDKYLTRDHVQSVRDVTNSSESVEAQYDYSPWGALDVLTGAISSESGFTGHYIHTPSDLLLSPFRAFDEIQGRWLSEDPLRSKMTESSHGRAMGILPLLETYTYVRNKPVSEFDASGLWSSGTGCTKDDPRCNGVYTPCFEYSGANARCFCKCAGNDSWSSMVRCCLFSMYGRGFGSNEAHILCYAGVTAYHGPDSVPPYPTLFRCYRDCKRVQEKECVGC